MDVRGHRHTKHSFHALKKLQTCIDPVAPDRSTAASVRLVKRGFEDVRKLKASAKLLYPASDLFNDGPRLGKARTRKDD